MAFEVVRLERDHKLRSEEAKMLVADAFGTETRTVTTALTRNRKHAEEYLDVYVNTLRNENRI